MVSGSSGLNSIHSAIVKYPLMRVTLKSEGFIGSNQFFQEVFVNNGPAIKAYGFHGVVFDDFSVTLGDLGYIRTFGSTQSVIQTLGYIWDQDGGGGAGTLRLGNTGVELFVVRKEGSSPEIYNIYKSVTSNGLSWSQGLSSSLGTTVYSQSTSVGNYTNRIKKITMIGPSDCYILTHGPSTNNSYPLTTLKYLALGNTPLVVWSNSYGITDTVTQDSAYRGFEGYGSTDSSEANYSVGNIQAFSGDNITYVLMERDPVIEVNVDGNEYFTAFYNKITMLGCEKQNLFWSKDIYFSQSSEESARYIQGGHGVSHFYFGIEKYYIDKRIVTTGTTNTWIRSDTQSSLALYKVDYSGNMFQRYIGIGSSYTLGLIVGGISSSYTESLSLYYRSVGGSLMKMNIFDTFGSSTDVTGNVVSLVNDNNEYISIELGNRL